jgi:hypothetical protein
MSCVARLGRGVVQSGTKTTGSPEDKNQALGPLLWSCLFFNLVGHLAAALTNGTAAPLRGAIGHALRRGCRVSTCALASIPSVRGSCASAASAVAGAVQPADPLTGTWDNRITRGQSRQARTGEPAGSWKLDKKKLLAASRLGRPQALLHVTSDLEVHLRRRPTSTGGSLRPGRHQRKKLDNPRDITHGHQALDKSRQRNNTTGAKGMAFDWEPAAAVSAGRSGEHLGHFKTKAAATSARP